MVGHAPVIDGSGWAPEVGSEVDPEISERSFLLSSFTRFMSRKPFGLGRKYRQRSRLCTASLEIVLLGGSIMLGIIGGPLMPPVSDTVQGILADAPSPHRIIVQVSAQKRVMPAQFFGFNAEDIKTAAGSNLWFGPKVPSQIALMHASLLRIPGGTSSQWIDWSTGKFIDSSTDRFNNAGRKPLTLGDWARIVKMSHTVPVFDLDVVNSSLSDQLSMLHAAARLGMPIRYVELGNELWDPTEPAYTHLYPTGADYGLAMNSWISAIKEAFPSAMIAVCGMDSSNSLFAGIPRMATWNASMLGVVRGENAITFHPYWVLAAGYEAGAPQSVVQTVLAGFTEWKRFSSETLPMLPTGVGVWLTEWNQSDLLKQGGHQSWIQALTVGAFALNNATDPQIDMSLVHDVVDQAANPREPGPGITEQYPALSTSSNGTKLTGRTANGYVLGVVFGAIKYGESLQSLNFVNGPSVSGVAELEGVRITTMNRRPGFVLINLSGQSQDADLSKLSSGQLTAVTLTAAPTADPGFIKNNHVEKFVTPTIRATGLDFQLPKYSITSITPS
jgi:hypothetical protein